MAKGRMHVALGNPVDTVPIKSFSKLPAEVIETAWQLVGPSVIRNINMYPIHKVIAAAYAEGVNHGYGIAKDEAKRSADLDIDC